MNLLLITFSFPPAGGVGVLRALSLAKYLPSNGVRVDVLTARNAPAVGRDASLLAQVPAEVKVHRTWTLDLPFGLRKLIKRIISGRGGLAQKSASAPSGAAGANSGKADVDWGKAAAARERVGGSPLKQLVANLLLPDPQIGWLPFALPAARRLVRRRKIDAVLITVPPFSSARLVMGLRRTFPGLPIVLDFRDEWLSTTLDLVSFSNNAKARLVAERTERAAVRAASAVVLVTEAARAELVRRYPQEPAGKFLCVHNGFDRPLGTDGGGEGVRERGSGLESGLGSGLDTAGARRDGTVTLTYIGTVYGSTDPTTLVEAVEMLPARLRTRLRLRFIGHVETEALRAQLLGLGGTVELRGFLPQAEALGAIDATDWLLLVTRDRINVAAKFYDYLGGGKPIVAAVHPEGDVRLLLEATGAGVAADVFSAEAIRSLLVRVLDPEAADALRPEAIVPDRAEIVKYHRSALAARYAGELRRLTAGSEGS